LVSRWRGSRVAIVAAAAVLLPCLAFAQPARQPKQPPRQPSGGGGKPLFRSPSSPAPLAPRVSEPKPSNANLSVLSPAEQSLAAGLRSVTGLSKDAKHDEAIRTLDALIVEHPEHERSFAVRFRLGQLHALKGDVAPAEEHLRAAVRVGGSTVEARAALMGVLITQSKFEDAQKVGRQLAALDDCHVVGMVRLCHAHRMLGNLDEALAVANRVLAKYPAHTGLLGEKAFVLAGKGDVEEARRLCRQVLSLDPDVQWAKDYLDRVR
jgi:Flp pilus assembly protein TadD